MTEDTIDTLDASYLTDVKMVINPSYWDNTNGTGTKGYINVLHATIDDDPFESDYMDDEEAVPFD